MADIKLRFTINENQASEQINSVATSDTILSNVSIKQANGVFNGKANGQGGELLSWAYGKLRFNEQGFLCNMDSEKSGVLGSEQNANMFVWGATNENGEKEITITISGANVKDIVIFGNQQANQFITRAYFDDIEVFSDDYKLVYSFPNESDTHTIRIVEWNRPMYNAMITLIRVQLKYMDIDKYNGLQEIESQSQSTGQPKDIFYGTLANSGSASIIDRDGELYDMLNDGILPNSDLPIEIYANGKLIQKHLSIDSDYTTSANSRTMSVEFSNIISKWDNVQYEGRPLTWRNDIAHSETAYTLLKEVMSSPKLGFSSDYIDNIILGELIVVGNEEISVKAYLQRITIPYAYLPSDTMQNTIDKFCVLAQLNFIQKDNGDFAFVGARPIAKNIYPIVIPTSNQFGQVNTTALLKNKYKAVEVQAKNVKDEIDFFSLVETNQTNFQGNVDEYNNELNESDRLVEKEGPDTIGVGIVTVLYMKNYYFTKTFTFDKVQNLGLYNIIKMYNGKDDNGNLNIKTKLIYDEQIGNVNIPYGEQATWYRYPSNIEDIDISYSQPTQKEGQVENIFNFGDGIGNATLELRNHENIATEDFSLIDNNKKFSITLNFRVGLEQVGMTGGFNVEHPDEIIISRDFDKTAKKKIPKQLEISFYGDKRVISFEDITLDFPQGNAISDNETVKLNGSELTSSNILIPANKNDIKVSFSEDRKTYTLSSDTIDYVYRLKHQVILESGSHTTYTIRNKALPYSIKFASAINQVNILEAYDSVESSEQLIAENIINDYNNGLMTTTATISCSDYYDTYNNKVKNWAKGETIQVGDILQLNKDRVGNTYTYKNGEPIYWKVTGRTFRQSGVPMLDLELQECKLV